MHATPTCTHTHNTVWVYRGVNTHTEAPTSFSNHSCLIAVGTPSSSPSYHSSSPSPTPSPFCLFPLRHPLYCLEMIKLPGILRFLACVSALRQTVERSFIYSGRCVCLLSFSAVFSFECLGIKRCRQVTIQCVTLKLFIKLWAHHDMYDEIWASSLEESNQPVPVWQ